MLNKTYLPRQQQPGFTPSAESTRSTPCADAVSDQYLMHRIVAHDHQAFEQLYRRYARRVAGYLKRVLPPHIPTEDVLHEVMLLVWRQAAQFDVGKALGPWLCGIARRKAFEAMRAVRTQSDPPSAVEEEADSAEGLMEQHDLAQAVTLAVATLPPAERQVIELTYYHDLSYPEIAARVSCPVNTVKTRMARARHRLAPQLCALGFAQPKALIPTPKTPKALRVVTRFRPPAREVVQTTAVPSAVPCEVSGQRAQRS